MSWSDYMREHGREEYDAWDATVKPLMDRIAALESALAIFRRNRDLQDAVAIAVGATWLNTDAPDDVYERNLRIERYLRGQIQSEKGL